MNTSIKSERPRICLIFRGPNWDLDHFALRLYALSERFEGRCFIGHSEDGEKTYGKFTVETTRWSSGVGFTLRHFWRIVRFAFAERSRPNRTALVVSADPLKGGIFAYVAARIIGAKFAPEVNGDFANPANYMDGEGRARGWLKRKLMIAVATSVLKRADGMRVLYPNQLDFLSRHLERKIVHTVFEFVDLRPFRNYGEEKVVLFAGFPFFLKGVDTLIEAFKRLAPKYPDWQLKILGWFPDPSVMKAHIGDCRQIVHHPAVHHRDMPEHIGRCGIFVLPSRTEAMGRVLLEAMAAAKPRIGSKVGGIPTVIDHETDGLLFDCGNVDQLTAALDRLMADPDLRKRLGEAGERRMRAEFSVERYVERIGGFYNEVMASR